MKTTFFTFLIEALVLSCLYLLGAHRLFYFTLGASVCLDVLIAMSLIHDRTGWF